MFVDKLLSANPSQKKVIKIYVMGKEFITHRRFIIFLNLVAIFSLVFPIKNQRYFIHEGHFRSYIFLSYDKWLERMKEVFKSKPCQKCVHLAVWCKQYIIKTPFVDPTSHILPAFFGIK